METFHRILDVDLTPLYIFISSMSFGAFLSNFGKKQVLERQFLKIDQINQVYFKHLVMHY